MWNVRKPTFFASIRVPADGQGDSFFARVALCPFPGFTLKCCALRVALELQRVAGLELVEVLSRAARDGSARFADCGVVPFPHVVPWVTRRWCTWMQVGAHRQPRSRLVGTFSDESLV